MNAVFTHLSPLLEGVFKVHSVLVDRNWNIFFFFFCYAELTFCALPDPFPDGSLKRITFCALPDPFRMSFVECLNGTTAIVNCSVSGGYCEDSLCVCYYAWAGVDCASPVVSPDDVTWLGIRFGLGTAVFGLLLSWALLLLAVLLYRIFPFRLSSLLNLNVHVIICCISCCVLQILYATIDPYGWTGAINLCFLVELSVGCFVFLTSASQVGLLLFIVRLGLWCIHSLSPALGQNESQSHLAQAQHRCQCLERCIFFHCCLLLGFVHFHPAAVCSCHSIRCVICLLFSFLIESFKQRAIAMA